ncbi:HNH endonuclease [Streptomyces sp. 8K308]|uniref:HNH endonuclease family protein n=1 Tax=Streptomyces sp. 8K308 TaxID=2530388 RepID=UPI001047B252|nr:HNH endonuclease family protein [Streptomyces sp. 8K308]TDC21218.1 HNH endonuclease [Streptomyces sp. 8K308]
MRLLRATIVALTALPTLLAWPASPAAAAPGERVTAPLSELIAALPVRDEGSRAGYSRERFRHWVDTDRDGCDTREEVLLAEAAVKPRVTGRCVITPGTGTWRSWYDRITLATSTDVDIDHMVPLAEAWESGASVWSPAARRAYANDLADPRALVAVHDSANQSKGDQDPAEWMPPAASATCRYITAWVVIKTRYGLTADPVEHAAIEDVAAGCDDREVTVVQAR